MRQRFYLIMVMIFVFCNSATSCNKSKENINEGNNTGNMSNDINMSGNKIIIKVNSKTFTATLLDNNSAKAFRELLPLTIKMVELNGNEKYYDLSRNIPTNSISPGTIKNGDLMLYESKTLVLFYGTFSTPYSYTKLGAVDDAQGLASALGSGNVTVTFESNQTD